MVLGRGFLFVMTGEDKMSHDQPPSQEARKRCCGAGADTDTHPLKLKFMGQLRSVAVSSDLLRDSLTLRTLISWRSRNF